MKYSRQMKFSIPENHPVGSEIGIINCSSIDFRTVALLPIMRSPVDQYILVDTITGKLRLKRHIDRENICPESPEECGMSFKVKILSGDNIIDIFITIIDINDNVPKFTEDEYRLKISESSKVGSELTLPYAIDKDSELNGIVKYRMIADSLNRNVEKDFKIFVNKQMKILQPILKQIQLLDRETTSKYKFYLRAEDSEGKYGETLINIDVEDANDNYPQWIGLPYQVTIRECEKLNQALIVLSATDIDQGSHGSVIFKINPLADQFVKSHFHLYGTKLFLSTSLDYENRLHRKIIVPVSAVDDGGLTNSTNVEIKVEDCNDNSPIIAVVYQKPNYGGSYYNSQHEKLSINENDDKESIIVPIDVTDADSGENGRVSCELENYKDYFRLTVLNDDNEKGLLYHLVKNQGYSFDREKTSTVKVDINCKDNGAPPKNTKQTLMILINDINDNEPKLISSLNFNIYENNENGALVGKFEATDLDENDNKPIEFVLVFESVVNTFSLSKDGHLYANIKLDRESVSKYKIGIKLIDSKTPVKSSFYNITINVLDDNDGIPVYTGEKLFRIIESNGELTSQIVIGQLNATDSDEGINSVLEFSIDHSKILPINVKSFYSISKSGLLTVRGNLDREKHQIHQLLIIIQDKGEKPQSTSVQITIHLLDINDNKPVFTFPNDKEISINITVDTSVKTTIGMIKAEDRDLKENGTVQFKCHPLSNYFSIDKTGEIVLEKALGQTNGILKYQYSINVQAYDLGNPPLKEYTRLFIYVTDNQIDSSRRGNEFWENSNHNNNNNNNNNNNVNNNNEVKNKIDEPGFYNSNGQQKRKQMNVIILMIMVVLVMIIFFAVVAVLSFIYFKKERFTFFGAANTHRYNTEKAGTNYTSHKTNQPCDVSRMIPYPNLTNNPITDYNSKEPICVGQYSGEQMQPNSSNFYNTLILPDSRMCTFQNNNDEYQNRNSSTNSNDLHHKIALLDYSNFFNSDEYRDHEKEEYFPLNHNLASNITNNIEFNKRQNTSQPQQRPIEPEVIDYRVEFKTPQSQKRSMKINSSFV